MAAIVIDASISSANWSKARPRDYRNADLDKAIAGFEGLARKAPAEAVKPAAPSIKGYEAAIRSAETIARHLKECDGQLDKVAAAAKKAEGELRKLADKMKGDEKRKYLDAAGSAAAIGSSAAAARKAIA